MHVSRLKNELKMDLQCNTYNLPETIKTAVSNRLPLGAIDCMLKHSISFEAIDWCFSNRLPTAEMLNLICSCSVNGYMSCTWCHDHHK